MKYTQLKVYRHSDTSGRTWPSTTSVSHEWIMHFFRSNKSVIKIECEDENRSMVTFFRNGKREPRAYYTGGKY